MSGGSFNYLCWRELDLNGYLSDLSDMVDTLRNGGVVDYRDECEDINQTCQEAADILQDHLDKTRAMMRTLRSRHATLEELIKAVEWQQSGDYGPDAIEYALKKLIGEIDEESRED